MTFGPSDRRITVWVCVECDYARLEQRGNSHVTTNPDDPNGALVIHTLREAVFVEARDDPDHDSEACLAESAEAATEERAERQREEQMEARYDDW